MGRGDDSRRLFFMVFLLIVASFAAFSLGHGGTGKATYQGEGYGAFYQYENPEELANYRYAGERAESFYEGDVPPEELGNYRYAGERKQGSYLKPSSIRCGGQIVSNSDHEECQSKGYNRCDVDTRLCIGVR